MNELIQQDNNQGFMTFSSINDAMKFGEIIANSSICPKCFSGKPGDVLVAVQMGLELGLKPMQSLQNIAVINGRPSIWGDAMLAVCKAGHDFEYCNETFDEEKKTASCAVKRKGEPEQVRTFSFNDAKLAGLLGKTGPWTQYPARMCQMRARGFALRDVFPHLLRGLISTEEAKDYPINVVEHKRKIKTVANESSVKTIEHEKPIAVEPSPMSEETRLLLIAKMASSNVADETVEKWLDKAHAAAIEDLSEEQAIKIIAHLEKKS